MTIYFFLIPLGSLNIFHYLLAPTGFQIFTEPIDSIDVTTVTAIAIDVKRVIQFTQFTRFTQFTQFIQFTSVTLESDTREHSREHS